MSLLSQPQRGGSPLATGVSRWID